MRLQYADGKGAWKRINRDNIEKDFIVAGKNVFKWGRYVETKQGSTLTFPGGDTIIYRDTDRN